MASERGNRGGIVVAAILLFVPIVAIVLPVYLGYRMGALNEFLCEGDCPSEYAVAPEGVTALEPIAGTEPRLVHKPIDKSAFKQAVSEPLSDPALGHSIGFVALDAQTGEVLMSKDPDGHIPASTTKVLTGWAVLTALGPEHRFTTAVRHQGDTLILVGDGDPYLLEKSAKRTWAGTSLEELAAGVAAKIDKGDVKLEYQDTLFAGPPVNPIWLNRFVPRTVQPITSLITRKAEPTSRTPSADVAEQFSAALAKHGIHVTNVSERHKSSDAAIIAEGRSATLANIVSQMLAISDNTGAEILMRHVALAQGENASFDGGVAAVTALLQEHGFDIDMLKLHDGSGLARENEISPLLLVELLRSTLGESQYNSLVVGMPVSGLTGSLTERFGSADERIARGVVRAKTGTLIGVSSLAGWANLSDGRSVVFAIMADQINGYPLGAPQDGVDRIAAAIAGCSC